MTEIEIIQTRRGTHYGAYNRKWTNEEYAYLIDNYGTMPAEKLASKLHRTKNALKIAAYRHCNGLNQRSNIYTAREVAKLLGIGCAKTIVSWIKRGYIKGVRGSFAYGATFIWDFKFDDITECLRERPWLVNIKDMEPCWFRGVVKDEYEKDPWYNSKEIAEMLGIQHHAINRYILRGWIKAVKRFHGKYHPWQGEWVIRRSDLLEFIKNDKRPERYRKLVKIKIKE